MPSLPSTRKPQVPSNFNNSVATISEDHVPSNHCQTHKYPQGTYHHCFRFITKLYFIYIYTLTDHWPTIYVSSDDLPLSSQIIFRILLRLWFLHSLQVLSVAFWALRMISMRKMIRDCVYPWPTKNKSIQFYLRDPRGEKQLFYSHQYADKRPCLCSVSLWPLKT